MLNKRTQSTYVYTVISIIIIIRSFFKHKIGNLVISLGLFYKEENFQILIFKISFSISTSQKWIYHKKLKSFSQHVSK